MIRDFQIEDTASIVDIWYQASLIAHPFLESAFLQKEKKNIVEIYLPNTKTTVYESDNKVTGFISMIENEVGAIFVYPNFQGKGIGRALMDHIVEKWDEIEVEVFENNHIGRSFYAQYGFEFVKKYVHDETQQMVYRLKYKVR